MSGKFKCGQCGDYSTDDFEEMRDHKASKSHIYEGIAPCEGCGVETKYRVEVKISKRANPAFCEKCAKEWEKSER